MATDLLWKFVAHDVARDRGRNAMLCGQLLVSSATLLLASACLRRGRPARSDNALRKARNRFLEQVPPLPTWPTPPAGFQCRCSLTMSHAIAAATPCFVVNSSLALQRFSLHRPAFVVVGRHDLTTRCGRRETALLEPLPFPGPWPTPPAGFQCRCGRRETAFWSRYPPPHLANAPGRDLLWKFVAHDVARDRGRNAMLCGQLLVSSATLLLASACLRRGRPARSDNALRKARNRFLEQVPPSAPGQRPRQASNVAAEGAKPLSGAGTPLPHLANAPGRDLLWKFVAHDVARDRGRNAMLCGQLLVSSATLLLASACLRRGRPGTI